MENRIPGTQLHRSGRLIPDGLDEKLVAKVVDVFYAKARTDDVIGPVFNGIIAPPDWPAHLATITEFWNSMLLGTNTYSGRPMPKHLAIPGLADQHFERWLHLFRGTVMDLCPPDVAALFIDRAERIAHSFRLSLAIHHGHDSTALEVMRAR